MIRATIDHEIRLTGAPPDVLAVVKRDLTVANPEHRAALKLGLKSQKWLPMYIRLYRREGDALVLPRGYLARLEGLLAGRDVCWEDRRLVLPPVRFGWNPDVRLREYQAEAVKALAGGETGGLVAPCGSGKTTVALKTIETIGQPALVIVHTRELATQWIDRAVATLGVDRREIGVVGDGRRTIGRRLTVGLVQTLANVDTDKIAERFGMVVLDEGHHVPATTFRRVLGSFPARYRLWLSATPERADGLTAVLFAVGGPVLHRVERSEVPAVKPVVKVLETNFRAVASDYATAMAALARDEARNRLVVKAVADGAENHFSLVLTERVEHAEVLADMLRARLPHLRVEVVHGGLSKPERERIMQEAKAKRVHVLVATKLAKEGLDLPHLDRLALAAPKRSAATIEQEIGRVMRPAPGKSGATVIDVWDSRSRWFRAQFWTRRGVYRRLGLPVRFSDTT